MTDLKKTVSRRSLLPHRGRRIVVSFIPGDIVELREHGRRMRYSEPIAAIFDWMAKREAIRIIAERKAKRKAGK